MDLEEKGEGEVKEERVLMVGMVWPQVIHC